MLRDKPQVPLLRLDFGLGLFGRELEVLDFYGDARLLVGEGRLKTLFIIHVQALEKSSETSVSKRMVQLAPVEAE